MGYRSPAPVEADRSLIVWSPRGRDWTGALVLAAAGPIFSVFVFGTWSIECARSSSGADLACQIDEGGLLHHRTDVVLALRAPSIGVEEEGSGEDRADYLAIEDAATGAHHRSGNHVDTEALATAMRECVRSTGLACARGGSNVWGMLALTAGYWALLALILPFSMSTHTLRGDRRAGTLELGRRIARLTWRRRTWAVDEIEALDIDRDASGDDTVWRMRLLRAGAEPYVLATYSESEKADAQLLRVQHLLAWIRREHDDRPLA